MTIQTQTYLRATGEGRKTHGRSTRQGTGSSFTFSTAFSETSRRYSFFNVLITFCRILLHFISHLEVRNKNTRPLWYFSQEK